MEPIFVSQFDFRVDGGLVFEEGYDGKILCRPFAIPVPVFSWSFESQIIQNSSKYQMWLDGTLHIKQVCKLNSTNQTVILKHTSIFSSQSEGFVRLFNCNYYELYN